MNRHFTVSAVVLHKGFVLLVYHPRLNAWVPPGGHIEAGELPDDAAIREVMEETGVIVDVISDTDAGKTDITGTSEPGTEVFILKHPLCLHQVKAFEEGEHVYHIDIVYLCRPSGVDTCSGVGGLLEMSAEGQLPQVTAGSEILQAKWVKLDELNSIELAPNVTKVVELAYSRLRCKNAALRA